MPYCGKTIPSREPTEADHEVLAELTNLSEKLKRYEARFILYNAYEWNVKSIQ